MGGKNERKDDWLDQLLHWLEKHKTFTGTVVIFSGFVIGVSIAYWLHSLTGVGIMGIFILLFVLIGANILSEKRN